MKYKNKSKHKMLLQLSDGIKEVYPGEIFESSELLSYSFLEEQKTPPPVKKVVKKVRKKTTKKKVAPPQKENLDGSDSTKA